jgi:hypothetical protein
MATTKSVQLPPAPGWGARLAYAAGILAVGGFVYLLAEVLPGFLPLVVALLAGALVGLVLLRRLAWALYALVVSLFVADFLSSLGFIPRAATWVPEGVILLLAAAVLVQMGVNGRRLRGSLAALDIAVAALAVLSFVSAVVSAVAPITFLLGLRADFKYILMFYFLINLPISTVLMRRLFALFWGLMLAQPLVVAWQYYGGDCRGCYHDHYYGTLMSTATIAIMAGFAAALGLSFYLVGRSKKYLLLLLPLLFSLGLNDAKAGFWFVAAVSIALLGYRAIVGGGGRRLSSLILATLILGMGFYAALTFASQNLRLNLVGLLTNVNSVLKYDWIYDPDAGQKVGRTFDLQLALDTTSRLPLAGLIGAGPGSASQSVFTQYSGSVYREVARRIGRDVFWVQLARILVEFGYLGLLILMATYGGLLLLAHRAFVSAATPYWKALALSLIGFVVVSVAAHVYQTIMDVPGFILWFTAAMLVRHRREAAEAPAVTNLAEPAA